MIEGALAGLAICLFGVLSLLIPRFERLRWALFVNLVTLGVCISLWRLLEIGAFSSSSRIGAFVALGWAVFVWIRRVQLGERGRLSTENSSISMSQFMCLAASTYTALISLYFIVPQAGLALVQTGSYTYLFPSQWLFSDLSGAIDLLMIAMTCFVLIEATRSTYLLTPMYWSLVLAGVWAALVIPPIIPAVDFATTAQVGIPSYWLVVLILLISIMLLSFVWLQRLSWTRNREFAWRKDAGFLLRPPRSWPWLGQTAAIQGGAILIVGALLLVFPAPADSFRSPWPGILCGLGACFASISIFVVLHRHWYRGLGELGFALMTLAVCCWSVSFLPDQPAVLAERFPLIFTALVFGCAISAAWWMWLAGVWDQQLDNGRAWTTAGRLIPCAQRSSFAAGLFAGLFALKMSVWPLQESVMDDASFLRIAVGGSAILFALLVAVWCYKRVPIGPFRSLITLSLASLGMFVVVRMMPYSSWGGL